MQSDPPNRVIIVAPPAFNQRAYNCCFCIPAWILTVIIAVLLLGYGSLAFISFAQIVNTVSTGSEYVESLACILLAITGVGSGILLIFGIVRKSEKVLRLGKNTYLGGCVVQLFCVGYLVYLILSSAVGDGHFDSTYVGNYNYDEPRHQNYVGLITGVVLFITIHVVTFVIVYCIIRKTEKWIVAKREFKQFTGDGALHISQLPATFTNVNYERPSYGEATVNVGGAGVV